MIGVLLVNSFSKISNFLIESFFALDTHTKVPGCEKCGFLTQIFRNIRYRAVAKNSAITLNEKRLLSIKNKHVNKRAFIIGNGPSLKKCDLKKLEGEYTFGVNAIFLNYEKMGFYPTYYVVEDVFVAEDRASEINSYQGPKMKFFGNYLRHCLDVRDDTSWLNVRVKYGDYPGFPHFSKDAARMVWVGGSVTYICMQLAYYMGFSEVYLVGFDHSYIIPDDVKQVGNAITSTTDDPNHFHPDYFGKGYRWHDPRVDRMEKGFINARRAFEADGRKILNATVGGNLEVFERVDYNSILSSKS